MRGCVSHLRLKHIVFKTRSTRFSEQLLVLLDEAGALIPDIGRLIVDYAVSAVTVPFFQGILYIPYRGGGHDTSCSARSIADSILYRVTTYKGRCGCTKLDVLRDRLQYLFALVQDDLPDLNAQDFGHYLAWFSNVIILDFSVF